MLFRFRRYYIVILLLLFASLNHLNGFPLQNGKLTNADVYPASESQFIDGFFHPYTSGVSHRFQTYNSRDYLIEIEGPRLYPSHFPTAPKKKIYEDVDNYLIDNAAFRDYNHKTLAYSLYFVPVKDLLVDLCIFRQ